MQQFMLSQVLFARTSFQDRSSHIYFEIFLFIYFLQFLCHFTPRRHSVEICTSIFRSTKGKAVFSIFSLCSFFEIWNVTVTNIEQRFVFPPLPSSSERIFWWTWALTSGHGEVSGICKILCSCTCQHNRCGCRCSQEVAFRDATK